MNSEILAYTAGIVDGEGCVAIAVYITKDSRTNYRLVVDVANTYKVVIAWLHETFGGSISFTALNNRRPCWIWHIGGRKASLFLESIRPFLRVKALQADLAVEFQVGLIGRVGRHNRRTDEELAERESYKEAISMLNHGTYVQI